MEGRLVEKMKEKVTVGTKKKGTDDKKKALCQGNGHRHDVSFHAHVLPLPLNSLCRPLHLCTLTGVKWISRTTKHVGNKGLTRLVD